MKIKDIYPMFSSSAKMDAQFFARLPISDGEPKYIEIVSSRLWTDKVVIESFGEAIIEKIDCDGCHPQFYLRNLFNFGD